MAEIDMLPLATLGLIDGSFIDGSCMPLVVG